MKNSIKIQRGNLIAGIFSIVFFSCEDKINPSLESAAPVLVVDAWLNNKPGPQVITLTQTQAYFDNTNPTGVSNAVVTVSDYQGKTYSFPEDDKNQGNYLWKPLTNEDFGTVCNRYQLSIAINGETFESTSYMGRVPPIDSITFDTDQRPGSNETVMRGEFWATDPVGRGDAYFIKTYKNGVLLNKPSEINVAYDAGFFAGGDTDGVTFITPIRRGINA